MKSVIIVIVVFIVFVNAFTFIKIRKRRNITSSINSVEKFHKDHNIDVKEFGIHDQMDYIGREELHEMIQEELHSNDKKKKFEFRF